MIFLFFLSPQRDFYSELLECMSSKIILGYVFLCKIKKDMFLLCASSCNAFYTPSGIKKIELSFLSFLCGYYGTDYSCIFLGIF